MRILFKTLSRDQFYLEVDPSMTILQVKQLVEKEKGFTVDSQKLICAGKVLVDEKPVSEYNVKDTDFFVVMVAKPKAPGPAGSPAGPAAAAAPVAAPSPPPAAAPPVSTAAPAAARAPAPLVAAPAPAPAAPAGPETLTPEMEASVQQVIGMGFPREEAIRAVRAAFGDAARAVDYLFNGIPEGLQVDPNFGVVGRAGGAAPAAGGHGHGAAGGPGAGGAGAAGGPLGPLRMLPQFNQLRAMLQMQPDMLPALLEQIGRANPALLQLINANRQEFITMMQEPLSEAELGELAAQAGAGGGGGAPPPGRNYIQVTPEERAAIERLEAMGFPRELAVEAFFACDKNEDLAANYLLNMNFGDES